jgi:hypothetical protein
MKGEEMRYKIVDLFAKRVANEFASEQEAISNAIGMAGVVVVDRSENRIYDGEYQQWTSIQDYCQKFPAVAWITEV